MPDSTIPKFLLNRAKTILKDMRVPEHLQGFTFLAEAAALKSLFTCRRYMQIYTHIAKAHDISSKTVTNSMSYALDCNRENICANLKINLNELCCSPRKRVQPVSASDSWRASGPYACKNPGTLLMAF